MSDTTLPALRYWLAEQGPDTAIWSGKQPDRYITFEPDCAGLNNIRMAFECVASIAVFTGRTLVLPPAQPWVFIDYDYSDTRDVITRSDFPRVFDIAALEEFLAVITTEELLERDVPGITVPDPVKAQARDTSPIEARAFTPGAPSGWARWLRENVPVAPWNPIHTLFCHPDIRRVVSGGLDPKSDFVDGRTLVEIDQGMARSPVIHFPADHQSGRRSFGQAVNMVAFAYPELARMHRRFLKRGVRYTPEIFATASRLIEHLGPGAYSALHIRRNDFAAQFGAAGAQPPEHTAQRINDILPAGEPLYIATDETDPSHLAPLSRDRPVITWQDLAGVSTGRRASAAGVPALLAGPVEQLVCTAARAFVGTRFSTFSMYINRLRSFTGAADTKVRFHTPEPNQPGAPPPAPAGVRKGRDWSTEYTDLWRRC